MKLHSSSVLATLALIGLSACGRDDATNATTQMSAKATVADPGRPERMERAFKAFDDESDFQDFAGSDGQFNATGAEAETRYLTYKAEYERLWANVAVRPERNVTLDWYVNQVVANKTRYMKLQETTGVPWYWIGITHGLEGSFDFTSHLHNGDSLSAPTWQVPAGRPLTGRAPFTWEFSAADALAMKSYNRSWGDWSVPALLAYSFERYNGFGYRSKGINSPYLWSFSYHYTKGKYTFDGFYDPTAVSAQAGAMTILRRGMDRGAFSLFTVTMPETVKADDKPVMPRTLMVGMSDGPDVLLLKMRLKSFGFYTGALDRRFDATLETAVRAAQKFHGLSADGAVGAITWGKLWPNVSDANWMKAWGSDTGVDVRAMAGDKCIFKVVAKDPLAISPFLRSTTNARTISFGGEAAKVTLPNACPDIREVYDLKAGVIVAPAAPVPSSATPATKVTWHKLFRGTNDEWHMASFDGATFVSFLSTRVKADILSYLDRHNGARNLVPALNIETPVVK